MGIRRNKGNSHNSLRQTIITLIVRELSSLHTVYLLLLAVVVIVVLRACAPACTTHVINQDLLAYVWCIWQEGKCEERKERSKSNGQGMGRSVKGRKVTLKEEEDEERKRKGKVKVCLRVAAEAAETVGRSVAERETASCSFRENPT